MSVSFCFMVTKDLSKESIWQDWFDGLDKLKFRYHVYAHTSNPSNIKSKWFKKYLIDPIPTTWDMHMEAEMTLFKKALVSNDEWFINLSESTVPFVSPSHFVEMVKEYHTKTLMTFRKPWWNIWKQNRANLKLFDEEARFGNSEWCAICNEDMKVLISLWENTDIISKMMEKPHADESIFSVGLYFGNKHKNVIKKEITVIDWDRTENNDHSPHTFIDNDEEDQEYIQTMKKDKFYLFIRKIHKDFPDEEIENWIWN